MGEEFIAVDPQILNDLRDAIAAWIPKRRETVAAIEELANNFARAGKVVTAVRAGAGAAGAAGALGFAAIFGTGGLATPLIAAATALGAIAGGEIFKKHRFQALQENICVKFDREIETFTTVIEKFDRLNKAIEKSDQKSALNDEQSNLLTRYSAINKQIAKVDRIVSESIRASLLSLAGLAAPHVEEIIGVAMKAAKNRAVSALLQGLSEKISEDIAKEAGKAAGKAVIKEVQKLAKVGEILKSKARAIETLTREAITAAKKAARDVLERAMKEAGIAHVMKVAGAVLPIRFAFQKIAEGIKAGQEMADVEKELREDIAESKKEANVIVKDIYIPLLKIAIPFPESKL